MELSCLPRRLRSIKEPNRSEKYENNQKNLRSNLAGPYGHGTVTEVTDGGIVVEVMDQESIIGDLARVFIDENTSFDGGVSREFQVGNVVAFTIGDSIRESYPVQVDAKRIANNDPPVQPIIDPTEGKETAPPLDEEEDMIIGIDPREIISGYFDGEFPHKVLTREDTTVTVEKDWAFAIALDENASTGYIWEYTAPEALESVGDGVQRTSDMPGAGGIHYYGFKSMEPGTYTIEFNLIRPDGEIEETVTFTATIQ